MLAAQQTPLEVARKEPGIAMVTVPAGASDVEVAAGLLPEDLEELISIRHDIHADPELGHQEFKTAALVALRLNAWGFDAVDVIAGTGVVGTLRGRSGSGRSIGLRADLDALPLDEAQGRSYRSTTPGVSHACGHDGHVAVLLGAARVLSRSRAFPGTAYFIFQPAEEGLGGAQAMIDAGLFERYPCEAIFALHTAPGLPVGMVATRPGVMMAGSLRFDVAFHGPGGHGGLRSGSGADVTLAQASFITALQSIVARDVPALESAVVSVGYVKCGEIGGHNVSPTDGLVGGTVRFFAEAVRALIEQRIAELAESVALGYRCSCSIETRQVSPPLVNDAAHVAQAVEVAKRALGEGQVLAPVPRLTSSEDFAVLLGQCKGAFLLLGNGSESGGATPSVHSASFDFNDAAIPTGVALLTALVCDFGGVVESQ
jgi:amidohydrolase